MNKKTREVVYNKYGGHCAYCGREIAYKEMQVDHLIPKRNGEKETVDDIENLMPSCRACNHYKRAHDLETFRKYIEEIPDKLSNNYIYKIGILFGLVKEERSNIKFYFEKIAVENRIAEERGMKREDLHFVWNNGSVVQIYYKNALNELIFKGWQAVK